MATRVKMGESQCVSCMIQLEIDNCVSCSFCKATYHYRCVGMLKTTLNAISSSDSIFWACSSCKIIACTLQSVQDKLEEQLCMIREHDRILKRIMQCVDKPEEITIIKKIPETQSVSKQNTSSNTVNILTKNAEQRGHKNASVEDITKNANEKKKVIIVGAKKSSDDQHNAIMAAAPPQSKAEIHAFNLSVNCTEEDLRQYIKENIGDTEIYVQKLNARHDFYSSFKIEVDEQYKTTIMSADFWPDEVRIQDFVHGPNWKDRKRVNRLHSNSNNYRQSQHYYQSYGPNQERRYNQNRRQYNNRNIRSREERYNYHYNRRQSYRRNY